MYFYVSFTTILHSDCKNDTANKLVLAKSNFVFTLTANVKEKFTFRFCNGSM